ncbi:MAG: pilin [Moraxellaceae bacterium]|nr:pilin [Moraxellaceae bacterium]
MRIYFSHQAGFSLIELMIVIAIIAVLSAVAVPQYQDYMTRAKWTVNLTEVEQVKLAVTDCLYAEGGQVTACDTSEKLGFGNTLTAPSHASSINISSNANSIALAVIGNPSAADCRIDITANVASGAVTWSAANVANNGNTCTRRKTGVTVVAAN